MPSKFMPSSKDKKLLGFTVLAIMVIGTIVIAGHKTSLHFKNKKARELILAAHPNAKDDPNTGSLSWGPASKNIRDDHVVPINICGTSHEIKSEDAKLIEQANDDMEADYELYFSGGGDKKFRKEYEKWLKSARRYGFEDWQAKCIIITTACRSNGYQADLRERSFYDNDDVRHEKQQWPAAEPGGSYHEICQAIDVANFAHAEKYLAKYGFKGGWRGLKHDPYHFNRGELRERTWFGEVAQKGWWQKKRAGKAIDKLMFWK